MKKTDAKNIKPAEPHEIPALVDRAKEIKAQIGTLSEELKVIEIKLSKAAEVMPHEPLKDEQREGRRVMLAGSRWKLPVIFTSDALIQSFKHDSPKHRELLAILEPAATVEPVADLLALFFTPPDKWETRHDDGQKFRAAVAEWLPPAIAPKFLAACRQMDKHGIAKSKTVIGFDQAEAVEAAPNGKEVMS